MNRIPARNRASSSTSQQTRVAEPSYPPIADYAAIGDGRTVALVSREGAIEWLCLPHFSAPSVFAALLDRNSGGQFAISPERQYTSARRYIEDTNVLETTLRTSTGIVRVTDFMPMPANARRLEPMREVLRIVEGIEGSVAVRVFVDPRPDYGRAAHDAHPARTHRAGDGAGARVAHSRHRCATAHCRSIRMRPRSMRASAISAGSKYSFSLCYTKGDIGCSAPLGAASEYRLASTLAWWAQWARRCCYDGPYRSSRDPQRSRAQTHDVFTVGRRHRCADDVVARSVGRQP